MTDHPFRVGTLPENPGEGHKYIIQDTGDELVYHARNFSEDIGFHKDILRAAGGSWDECVGGGMAEVYADDNELILYGESTDFGPESVTDDSDVQQAVTEAYEEATGRDLSVFTGDEAYDRLMHR